MSSLQPKIMGINGSHPGSLVFDPEVIGAVEASMGRVQWSLALTCFEPQHLGSGSSEELPDTSSPCG